MVQMSGADRLLHMEQEYKQKVVEKEELVKKIKHLTKLEKTHSNALGRHSKAEQEVAIGDGITKDKTAVLLNELRVWKEKVHKLR